MAFLSNPVSRTMRLVPAAGESGKNTAFLSRAAAQRAALPRMLRAAALAVTVSGFLAACSTMPDWARPGLIYGDEETAAAAATQASPDSEFPRIADVPERPAESSTREERQRMADGLAADRERSRYTGEVLRGGTEPPAPAPITAEPAPLPSIPAAPGSASRSSDGSSAASEANVIPMPQRGGRSSLGAAPEPEAPEPEAEAAPSGQGMAREETPAVRPEPVGDITQQRAPAPAAPAQPQAQQQQQQAAPAAAAAATAAATAAPAAQRAAATEAAQRVPAEAPAAPARSSTQFERSSAPQLSPEALSEAGGVVSSRYQQTHETVVIGGQDDTPVQINLDALDMFPVPGPGASLDTQIINGNGLVMGGPGTAQGGPAQPPFSVYFGHGKTALTGDDKANLAEVKSALDAHGTQLRVVGHASSRTADLALPQHKLVNFDVSMRRAEAVMAELIRQGIDPARIIVEARGEAEPVYYEAMPAGEAGNRRVEIYIE